jgi:hypothetical protein
MTRRATLRPTLPALAAALALGALTARAADPGAEAAKAYAVDTSGSTSSLKVGERGKLVVALRMTAPGWHVHPDAPLKVRLEAPAGLKLDKTDLGRKDLPDPKAAAPSFEAPFLATAAGAQEARATVDFFVCSDTACVKQAKTVAIPVAVR